MNAPGRALLACVRFYQRAISPAFPPRCRFHPSCSAYAVEAIELHGAGRGSWLAVRRLAKCAPWHPGGVDLVPVPADRPGTVPQPHSSDREAAAPPAPSTGPARAIDPAPPRPATQEESSVA